MKSADKIKTRKRLFKPAALMVIAIIVVTGFQLYWLKNNYDREKENLEVTTSSLFHRTVLDQQSSKLKLETINMWFDSTTKPTRMEIGRQKPGKKVKFNRPVALPREPSITLVSLIQEKMKDSANIDSNLRKYLIQKRNELKRDLVIDTVKAGEKGSVRRITISHSFDSLIVGPGPGAVNRVYVDSQSFPKGRFIAVGVGKDNKNDTPKVRRTNTLSDEEILMAAGSVLPPHSGDVMAGRVRPVIPGDDKPMFRFLYDIDSIYTKDSVTVKEITEAYTTVLKRDDINIGFVVKKLDSTEYASNVVTLGFSKPMRFSLTLTSTFGYMFDKLKLPILFSIFLIGITIASFTLLYRNMMKQKRLADLKNEFISNITHELKTPIATVGVAIEALKSFNAIDDPKRTREYLDISQNELQRLNLLVDKVLKLSMFEKKEVDLKFENLKLSDLVDEVVSSMRLQIEKYKANVTVHNNGDTTLQADRLHLLSVIFNLLDNALKYSKENPVIEIVMEGRENEVVLQVKDNGIGIQPEYKDRIFEKFFRVPHGDTHNAKGYGLGLSYASHVVRKHSGTITVESQPGSGTSFTITLPKQNT